MIGPYLPPRRSAAGDELRRRVRNIVAGSGRPGQRLPRRKCPESAARALWRTSVTQALTDLRTVIPRRPVLEPATAEIVRSLFAEILTLRLIDCHQPIDRTTERIAWQFGELFRSFRDPWKPLPRP